MNTGLTKVAVIRDPSVPVGQPADMWLNCPCGAKPKLPKGAAFVVVCACGNEYTDRGYLLSVDSEGPWHPSAECPCNYCTGKVPWPSQRERARATG